MSPRLTTFGDETTWRQVQENRHKALDSLTDQGRWLDLRFLAALGEPCCSGSPTGRARSSRSSAASRLEMQPRNIGSEFVGTRLRELADAIAPRTAGQILRRLSATAWGTRPAVTLPTAAPRPAWPGPGRPTTPWHGAHCGGFCQLPLAMRIKGIGCHHRASGPPAAGILLRYPSGSLPGGPRGSGPCSPAPSCGSPPAAAWTTSAAPWGTRRRELPSPMHTASEIAAAQLWLAERGTGGVIRSLSKDSEAITLRNGGP